MKTEKLRKLLKEHCKEFKDCFYGIDPGDDEFLMIFIDNLDNCLGKYKKLVEDELDKLENDL